MITAVDSSVLLDVIVAGSHNAESSYRALDEARRAGRIIACPVVWAEVRAVFARQGEMDVLVMPGSSSIRSTGRRRRPPVDSGGATGEKAADGRD